MATQQEIIQAQTIKIKMLEVSLGMQRETEWKLYMYLEELHKQLTNDNPEIVQATIKSIEKVLEKSKKHSLEMK
jgi:hypothetical protein